MAPESGPFTAWSERPVLVHPEGQALAHRLGVVVYVAEPGIDGTWLYVSPAVTAMTMLTPEALDAEPDLWWRHVHPEDRDEAVAKELRLHVEGRVRSEYRMIRPDGRVIWLVDDSAMARTPEGRIVQDGFLVDITEQKRTELMFATQAELVEAVSGPTDLPGVLTDLARGVVSMASACSCVIEVAGLAPVSVTTELLAPGSAPSTTSYSAPVMTPEGEHLGSVALHYATSTQPDAGELGLPAWAAHLVALAVTRAGERERAVTSRALLAATLESTVDGILVVDRDGHIVGHNERFASMWRIDRELMRSGDDAQVMASVLQQLSDPADFVAQVRDLYDNPEQTSFDELAFLDGRTYERYSQPQRVDGTTMGRVWSFRDVSDERRLQADLRHSEANLDRLVAQVRDYAIINLDPHGHVITWTAGAQRINGFTDDQILGRSHAAFYPPEALAAGEPRRLLEQARREGSAADEGWRVRHDGSRFWASVVLTALHDEGGVLRGFGKVTQDITERRDAELALARQARTLELLGTVATASNAASGVEDALRATLQAFCDYGGWQLAHAYLTDHDTGVLQHSAWHSTEPGSCAEFRARTEALPVTELGLPRTVFEQAKPEWIDRLDERAQMGRAVQGTNAGLLSGCAFPLMIREEPVGVLEFFSTEIRELDSATIQIMRHLGTQLGRVVERARAEHHLGRHALELRRLSKRLETVLNSAGEGIYGLDDADRVTFINDAGAALVGRRREEIVGQPVHAVLPAEVDSTPRRMPAGTQPGAIRPVHVGHAPEGGPVPVATRVMGRHTRADGTSFDSEWISAPIVTEGVESGAVVVFRDVSEQRAVERMKDQFLAVVSHELRTPLTSIRGALGLLGGGAAGELPVAAGRMVDLATVSTNRLIRLVTDILDIERLAAGQMTLYPQQVDTSTLVAASLQDTAAFVAERRVRIDVEGRPARVLADPDRAIQVLTNLITNAVKFSEPDSVVQVTTRQSGAQLCFEVRDHGPGLPADQLDLIFEPFRQADASDTRRHGGTGLGLAICRGLVEQHGGRIWGENHPEGGAQFCFTLPLAPTEGTISSV
ncbi:PAS domain S-box protein [Pedococcus sp. KACC 23699]|uniref:histidine kinase n=1 Tax=Pedococcus sp. KACC 23699 TaxID=3149228 RepID=A0AAU7JXV3_9MICO